MDRDRFDALTRLFATTGSRRAALGALLGVSILGKDPDVLAKRGKGRKGRDKENDQHHGGKSVQGEGRPGAKHKAHHKHKHTQRRRRKKRDCQDRGGQNPGPAVESRCGAKPCAPPESGSDRSECDFNGFNGQSFTGQDLHGAIFRRIDGRGTSFNDTDNRGSDFGEACLRSASFRGARLAGSTWDGACLVDADFSDADLGGEADALNGALLCRTTLPDGTRSDRDCGVDSPLCRSSVGGIRPGPCTGSNDCPDVPCRTKACVAGACIYTPVGNGPSPNALCDTRCCGITCCPTAAHVCHQGTCCLPRHPFDCGFGTCTGTTCRNCPFCVTVFDGSFQCAFDILYAGCNTPLTPCATNADCPANAPLCIVSSIDRGSSDPITVAEACERPGLLTACASISPCDPELT